MSPDRAPLELPNPRAVIADIFQGQIEDLSVESLDLSALFPPGSAQRALLRVVVREPGTGAADLTFVSEFIAARYGT